MFFYHFRLSLSKNYIKNFGFFFFYIKVLGDMHNSISSIIKEEKFFKTNDTKLRLLTTMVLRFIRNQNCLLKIIHRRYCCIVPWHLQPEICSPGDGPNNPSRYILENNWIFIVTLV